MAIVSIAAATLSSPPPQSGQRGSAPCCAPSMQRCTSSGLVPPKVRLGLEFGLWLGLGLGLRARVGAGGLGFVWLGAALELCVGLADGLELEQ